MKILVMPADNFGCGKFRLAWPAQYLAETGHDVTVIEPSDGRIQMEISPSGDVLRVNIDPAVDVVVVQRVTHRMMLQMVTHLRRRGVTVVMDIDDDLGSIHPDNPAFTAIHPKSIGVLLDNGQPNQHSWHHFLKACDEVSLVTCSTPELSFRYRAPGGRVRVLENRLPDFYYDTKRDDSAVIGWPASLHSHPNDPAVVGSALARLVGQGQRFRVVGDPSRVGRAFGLPRGEDPPGSAGVPPEEWPAAIAELGIGICPLADTRFNAAKSWLKPLELSAVGVPWVGSPRTEYRRLAAQGCGVLAERYKDWYRILGRMVNSHAWRDELSEAGRIVAEQHRLRAHAYRWLEAWVDARKDDRRAYSPFGRPGA